MRDKWEGLRKDCPWLQITTFSDPEIDTEYDCLGAPALVNPCHYKGCAIMYWFRHLMKPLFNKEELEEYKQYLEREKAFYGITKPLDKP